MGKMQIKIGFYYVISISVDFDSIFKICFNKHGCNFDNVSKIGFQISLK